MSDLNKTHIAQAAAMVRVMEIQKWISLQIQNESLPVINIRPDGHIDFHGAEPFFKGIITGEDFNDLLKGLREELKPIIKNLRNKADKQIKSADMLENIAKGGKLSE